MRTETPVLKRCCCCVPLRYGLLIWGYFVLIISLLVSTYVTVMLVMALIMKPSYHPVYFYDFLALIYFVELYLEVAFSIVLIVAAHKKNVKMLKIYYYYEIVFTVIFAMTSATLWSMSLAHTVRYFDQFSPEYKSNVVLYALQDAAPAFVVILLNCYVIFLVRSELVKLSSNHTFRFVNNAAESECKMNNGIYYNDEQEVAELNAPI